MSESDTEVTIAKLAGTNKSQNGTKKNETSENEPIKTTRKAKDYYFLDYLERKRKQQEAAIRRAQLQSQKRGIYKFEYTAYFKTDMNLKIEQIQEACIEQIENAQDNILYIAPFTKKGQYVIKFVNEKVFTSNLNKEIVINDDRFILKDINDDSFNNAENAQFIFTLKGMVRLSFLPPDFDFDLVGKFIKETTNNKIKVSDFSREKTNNFFNGNIKCAVSYRIEDHCLIEKLIGNQNINGFRTIFQLIGHPHKCKYCKEFSHESNSCPQLNLTCKDYNKKGHSSCKSYSAVARKHDAELSDDDLENEDIPDSTMVDESSEKNNETPNFFQNVDNSVIENFTKVDATTNKENKLKNSSGVSGKTAPKNKPLKPTTTSTSSSNSNSLDSINSEKVKKQKRRASGINENSLQTGKKPNILQGSKF